LPAYHHDRLIPTTVPDPALAAASGGTGVPDHPIGLVGGVLTGRGADIIVIDDPLKPEEGVVANPGPGGQ
jgi:hypothetical protein